ncbi:DUF2017 domain-containing protein [Enemella sp. A6]|uniref:DUF2017 domain-containing protein n=1 Tax=Enemella sp. A6 TaxID=3440152 RepID=UPI003EBEEE01
MKAFKKRRGGDYQAKMEETEVALISSLVEQLIELLEVPGEDEPGAEDDDPFEALARELADDPDQPEVSEDPAVRRLFPDAYPHDPAASSDFRRFTEADQRRRKIAEAKVVLQALNTTYSGVRPLRVEPDEVTAWLRTLNALRLTVATRLGITDEESAEELTELPDTDPRAFMYSVYEFLGWMQESLLHVL